MARGPPSPDRRSERTVLTPPRSPVRPGDASGTRLRRLRPAARYGACLGEVCGLRRGGVSCSVPAAHRRVAGRGERTISSRRPNVRAPVRPAPRAVVENLAVTSRRFRSTRAPSSSPAAGNAAGNQNFRRSYWNPAVTRPCPADDHTARLRHTCASLARRPGADPVAVQEHLVTGTSRRRCGSTGTSSPTAAISSRARSMRCTPR